MIDPVPVTPPFDMVTLAEAKDHLRLTHSNEDALIAGLIAAVSQHLDGPEGTLGRAIMTQVWQESFDGFLSSMVLRVSPATAVVSVSYTDGAGVDQTVTGARIESSVGVSRLLPQIGTEWPEGEQVTVTYEAGYSDAPAALKAAALLHIGTLYENRESVAEKAMALLPHGYHALVWPYRRCVV